MAPAAPDSFCHHRPMLAKRYADGLLGAGLCDLRSGLFLTAPRGTGKSAFLREDLIPELRARGAVTIYLDLWADRRKDPAQQIRDAIGASLAAALGLERSASRTVGARYEPDEFPTDAELAEYQRKAALTDLLELLIELSGKRACLLVDEIQQVTSTEAGIHALYELKAARDALTMGPKGRRLALVFAGSHRERVARLVQNRLEAFYGAMHMDLPPLDRAFTDEYAAWMNARSEDAVRLDAEQVWAVFQALDRRPGALASVLNSVAAGGDGPLRRDDVLAAGGTSLCAARWHEFDLRFDALSCRQQAALRAVLRRGGVVSPFSAESMALFSHYAGCSPNRNALSGALAALVRGDFLWRPARGKYAPADEDLAAWSAYRFAGEAGTGG